MDRASSRTGESCKHERALAAGGPAAGGEQRADEVAEIIGRGDQPRIGSREAEPLHHARQDQRVDETADAHGDGHGDHAGDGEAEWRSGANRHGGDHIGRRRGRNIFLLVQCPDRRAASAITRRWRGLAV
jgi:hypothetical protein